MAIAAKTVAPTVKNIGWTVTLAGTGINLMLGVLYTWSVISKNVPAEWGWSQSDKSWPYSIAVLCFAFATVIAGRMQDTMGPRIVATIGGVLVGAGMIIASFTSSPVGFMIGFGLLAGVGIGFGYSSATPPAIKWFTKAKTGLISGIVVSGFGLASVWAAPAAEAIVKNFNSNPFTLLGATFQGPNAVMLFLGIIFIVVVVILSQLLKAPPAGYVPTDGQKASTAASTKAVAPAVDHELGAGQMLRTKEFYIAWLTYAMAAGVGLMVVGKLATIAKAQADLDLGFILVALLAIGNGGGRIVAGVASDKIGRARSLQIFIVLQLIMMIILIFTTKTSFLASAVLLGICSIIMGASYGSNLAIFPAVTKDWYGLKNFGLNYGFIFTAWGVGGFILSQFAGAVYDANPKADNPFLLAYIVAAVLLAIALVLTTLFRSPHAKNK